MKTVMKMTLMVVLATIAIQSLIGLVGAVVSLDPRPDIASVGTSADIWIWTSEHEQIYISKNEFVVEDPNGKISYYSKDIAFHDSGFSINYPIDANWSPAGSVNTEGTYKVRLFFSFTPSGIKFPLSGTFVRNDNTSVGGIMIPVDKADLLGPYIGVTSTILVAAVATAIYVKRVKRRKEKR